ncbi:type VI secretion system tube protein Hcp [Paracoccaceae bacterium Fryx2]|nr:type VI secretion system tube protein Hcp [Paracoccaceae bacterium Fryx2]
MYDSYMYFPGFDEFKGETQDTEFKKKSAYELMSFSIGAYNTVNIGSASGGGGAGKGEFQPLAVMKTTDSASPVLFRMLMSGKHFDSAIIEMRRAGQTSTTSGGTFVKYEMKLVMVESLNWAGSQGSDVFMESVSFRFGAIKMEYFAQAKDGKMTKVSDAMWSRVNNTASLEV